MERTSGRRRPRGDNDDDLTRALGALLGLSPAASPALTAVAASTAATSTPIAALVSSPEGQPSGESDPWATDPRLDGPLAANLATSPASASEAEAAAGAATALQESGFGSALHTALGELRRIADDPVAVTTGAPAAPVPASGSSGHAGSTSRPGPDWPSAQPMSAAERYGGTPAEWLASLGDWWTARWRELLPGMVVAALVVVAFAVVLASGGKRSNTSHVDTRRPIDSGPSTTTAGLFSTAGVPPGEGPPPSEGPSSSSGSSDSPKSVPAPVTTKPSSDGPATPSAPSRATNPSSSNTPTPTAPPQTTPPPTDPPPTDPPPTVPTTVPSTPPSTLDICAISPTHC